MTDATPTSLDQAIADISEVEEELKQADVNAAENKAFDVSVALDRLGKLRERLEGERTPPPAEEPRAEAPEAPEAPQPEAAAVSDQVEAEVQPAPVSRETTDSDPVTNEPATNE